MNVSTKARLGLLFAVCGCLPLILGCNPYSAPAPPGSFIVSWGGQGPGIQTADYEVIFCLEYAGPKGTLEIVCQNWLGDEMTSEVVVASLPFVGLRQVQHAGYTTIEKMYPWEAEELRFTLTLHDLSKHFPGPNNAYMKLRQWGQDQPPMGASPGPRSTAFHCAAFSAPGDVGSGPSYYLGEKARFDTEDVPITKWSRGFRDKRSPDTRTVILARFR